jgi:hypothetical protein
MGRPPTSKIVKVQRPVFPPDGPWLIYDETHEWEDKNFYPDGWMREAMGGRMQAFFLAQRTAEGWLFRKRLKGDYHFKEEYE